MIRHFAKKAGLRKGIGCHTLRHTYAVTMLQSGMNIKDLQQRMGHARLDTTAIYLELFPGGRTDIGGEAVKKHPLFIRFFGEE